MANILSLLETEYCPPVDPALFFAIASDYDLSNESAVAEVRTALDSLKVAALEQEASDFDPSGSSRGLFSEAHYEGVEGAQLEKGTCKSLSEDTEISNISNNLSSLGISNGEVSETDVEEESNVYEELEQLSVDAKRLYLMEMFPETADYHIAYVLRNCGNNLERALQELLNHVYFNEERLSDGEERIAAKGIDAFSDDNGGVRGRSRKGKPKKKHLRIGEDSRSSSLPAPPRQETGQVVSKWETGKRDVEFISSRTGNDPKLVSSLYHTNGASVAATIYALLDLDVMERPQILNDDPVIRANTFELGEEFPSIPSHYLTLLIRITHPSTAKAHELARALVQTSHPSTHQRKGIEIIRQYAPIDLTTPDTKARLTLHLLKRMSPADYAKAATLNASYRLAGQAASAQARAAYRKSKSDHLMSGVAGYYGATARDLYAKANAQSAMAADALAASQSSVDGVDLHGVDVKNAVRIARERVTAWWSGLAEDKIRAHGGNVGFRIVTGVGYHSEGGKGKIGPAVVKMLVREGWKVEAGTGVVVVTGVAKTRVKR